MFKYIFVAAASAVVVQQDYPKLENLSPENKKLNIHLQGHVGDAMLKEGTETHKGYTKYPRNAMRDCGEDAEGKSEAGAAVKAYKEKMKQARDDGANAGAIANAEAAGDKNKAINLRK